MYSEFMQRGSRCTDVTTAAAVEYRQHQLPSKAAIEGPAICFALLEIEQDGGMTHGQFVRLLMSAIDTRMTLEDIQEAWQHHVDFTGDKDGDIALGNRQYHHEREARAATMSLPAFLKAFEYLAGIKYSLFRQRHGTAVDRLLLSDVFGNVMATPEIPRYGVCDHMVREDVCSFLLCQRPFTTDTFATYCNDGKHVCSTSDEVCGVDENAQKLAKQQDASPGRVQAEGGCQEQRPVTVSGDSCMGWSDFLAMASDLQLIPQILGVGDLKAAIENVSSAPHRLPRDGRLVDRTLKNIPPSGRNSSQLNHASAPGMLYTQFVEVLSLLAISAAGRLRSLYPDIAGAEPGMCGQGTEPVGEELACSASAVPRASHSNLSVREKESPRVSKGSGKCARRSNDAGGITRRHIQKGHADWSLKAARPDASPPSLPHACREPVGTSNACVPPSTSYDIGTLKALYHHVRTALDEKRTETRRLSRRVRKIRAVDGRKETSIPTPREHVPDIRSRVCEGRQDSSISDGSSDSEDTSDIEGGGACSGDGRDGEVIIGSEGLFEGRVAVAESAHLFDVLDRRLSDLEIDIFPCHAWERSTGQDGQNPSSCGTHDKQMKLEELSATTAPPAQRAGGGFARLVVIKELQPVPEHAPEEVRHLLELALDHHQDGRYTLALDSLDKAGTAWGTFNIANGGGSQSVPINGHPHKGSPSSLTPANGFVSTLYRRSPGKERHLVEGLGGDRRGGCCRWGLGAEDEVLVLLFKASIQQTAGDDVEALSTLLKADTTIELINERALREALRASVLSEIGVVVHYCNRTALGLRCFRLAFILHYKLLHHSEHYCPDEPKTDDAGTPGDRAKRLSYSGVRNFGATPAVQAVEVAAAIVLNNIGVCLAGVGDTGNAAVRALVIASSVTTSALGIEHPRSVVVARNLVLLKKFAGRCSYSLGGGHDGALGGRAAGQWEENMWDYLGGGRGNKKPDGESGGGQRGSASRRVIRGGFFFAGTLPEKGGGEDGTQKKGRSKKRSTVGKTKGKPACRR